MSVKPESPFDSQRIYATTDSAFRNVLAAVVLIGGSVALAIWVSPWFWLLVFAVLVLITALVVSVARARR